MSAGIPSILRQPEEPSPDDGSRCPSCTHDFGRRSPRFCPVCGHYLSGPPGGRGLFTLGGAIVGGCDALVAGYGVLVAVAVIVVGVQIALAVGQELVEIVGTTAVGAGGQVAAGVMGLCLSVFFMCPLNAGVMLLGVHAHRGEPLHISEMFAGFRRYFAVLVIYLLNFLLMVACMLPMLLGMVASALLVERIPFIGIALLLVGAVVSLVLAVSVGVRLSFSFLACLDPRQKGPGPWESMCLSWRLTRPIVWRLALLYVLISLVALSSILMFGIGYVLVGWPLSIAMLGAAYALTVERPEPEPTRDPWDVPMGGPAAGSVEGGPWREGSPYAV